MSWSLVIAVIVASSIGTPCRGALYGGRVRPNYGGGVAHERGLDSDGGAITDSTAGLGTIPGATTRTTTFGSPPDADRGDGADALGRFASTRAMKTGTTIAGVVFEVC